MHADRSSLIENSPFVWEGFVPPEDRRSQQREEPPPPPEDDPLDRLEFRGLTVMGGETYVSLHNPDNDESFWLAVDESDGGFTLVDYDGGDSIRVRRGDNEREITLRETQVAELPQSQQRRQGRESSGETQSAEVSEERLREAAQELRRRRAIRTESNNEEE